MIVTRGIGETKTKKMKKTSMAYGEWTLHSQDHAQATNDTEPEDIMPKPEETLT